MESEWKEYTLTEIYDVSSGLSKPAKDFGEGYPFVSFKDVFYNFFLPDELTQLVKSNEKEKEKCSVQRGDVFLTRTSETMDDLGMSSVARKDYPNATFNGFTKRLRPKPESPAHPEFVAYFLRSPHFRNEMLAFSTMSTRASLNNDMISRLRIKLPPLPEQKAIAHILGSLDDKIELNRRMNATLEGLAQALFQSWFVDFDPVLDNALAAGNPIPDELTDRAAVRRQALDNGTANRKAAQHFPATFQFTEAMGWIPEGWEVQALGDLSSILNGYAFQSNDYTESGIFVLRTKNFDENGLSSRRSDDVFLPECFSDSHSTYLSQPFDFHLVMVGASVGKTSLLLPHMLPALRNQNMWCFRPKKKLLSRTYLNMSVKKKVAEVMTWATGSARSFFRKSDFQKHEILVPSEELLLDFENMAGSQYLSISEKAAEIETLTKLRDTLLPQLISGELRIPDAAKLAEEALT